MCLSMSDKFSTKLKTKQKFNHDPVFIFYHNNTFNPLRPEEAKQHDNNNNKKLSLCRAKAQMCSPYQLTVYVLNTPHRCAFDSIALLCE